jgi:signal transduction histidine kinase
MFENDFVHFVKTLNESKRVNNYEFRINVTGPERYASISCRYFSYRGMAEGVISDITEKRNHLLQIQELNTELDTFLYHASHDIRSPLTSIQGLVNLIKTDPEKENIPKYTNKIEERVKHMDTLLRNLSEVAFNNSQPVQCSYINVHELVNEIVKPFLKEFPFIRCNIDIQTNFGFYTDEARLLTILEHIISNAFKYYRCNVEIPAVKVSFRNTAETAIIQVEDNGCGIEEPYMKDIFNLFFRMDSRGKGSGIGLYLAHSMIRKLKGSINVISKPGVGTCVTFCIPNAKSKIN